MAYLAAAAPRAPVALAPSSRRRSVIPTAVKATAGSNSTAPQPHPILSSLRLAASAAVLLAATSPAIACNPSPLPPPPVLTATVSPVDPVSDDSYPFEKLIVETAALARFCGAEAARARLSSAAPANEHESRLLAAQALFVDGRVDDAIAAFEELAREDPDDYRPLFCQAILYSVLGRAAESGAMLERCRDLAGDSFGAGFAMPASPADADADVAEAEAELRAEKAEAELRAEKAEADEL